MHNAFQGVTPATIEWRESKVDNKTTLTPFSPLFDDVYFNSHNGVDESRYVFLQGNNLAQRFEQSLSDFVIFETGFGSGLNFLLSCDLWQEKSTQGHLHYYSVEQYPVSPIDLKKIYQQLEINNIHSTALINKYPPILPGSYSIQINNTITLHLIFYPLDIALKEVATNDSLKVDAWFLDGFAPNKNPAMWHKGLLHFMALHAYPKNNDDNKLTSVATFTAASDIRRMLQHYGFEVSKRKGFGQKREMLTAQFVEKKLSTPKSNLATPFLKNKTKAKKIAVIGSGLAGCASAYSLQKRGFSVEIFEQDPSIASGCSNMPALLATPNLSIDHNAFSQLTFSGFSTLYHFLKESVKEDFGLVDSWSALQLTSDKYSSYQLQQYNDIYSTRLGEAIQWLDSSEQSFNEAALVIPAIQVNGRKYCQHLLKDLPRENIHLEHKIRTIDELSGFDQIIISTGYHSLLNTLALEKLPKIMPLRGQLTSLKSNLVLEKPINHDGHLFKYQDQIVLGATFENSTETNSRAEDNIFNIAQANKRFNISLSKNSQLQSWVGIRASSYDRFPFTGLYSSDKNQSIWLNYGFGTRGLCLSLLCAEIIAASINNETLPVSKNILQRLNPQRIL